MLEWRGLTCRLNVQPWHDYQPKWIVLCVQGDSITPGPASLGGLPALPAPPAGWCYKLFTYTPSGQAPGATLNCLAQLEAAWEAAGETGASASEGDQQAVGGPAATSSSAEGGPPGELLARLPPLAQAGGCCGAVTLRVSRNLFEGGTGCHEWEAGFFLSEIVLSNPSVVKGALSGSPLLLHLHLALLPAVWQPSTQASQL